MAYMTMQITSMLLSLFALRDLVGDYSFAYIMTKRGSSVWLREVQIVVAIVHIGENIC